MNTIEGFSTHIPTGIYPGDKFSAMRVAYMMKNNPHAVVQHSPAEVLQWYQKGRSAVTKVEGRTVGHAAITNIYDNNVGEFGGLVTDKTLSNRSEHGVAVTETLMSSPTVDQLEGVFALVLKTNQAGARFFRRLQDPMYSLSREIDSNKTHPAAFQESVSDKPEGPEDYLAFSMRRSNRSTELFSHQIATSI